MYENGICEILDLSLEYLSNFNDFQENVDLGCYCSIDYKTALITNFSKAIIPPPMCSLEFKSTEYISAFCLGTSNNHSYKKIF